MWRGSPNWLMHWLKDKEFCSIVGRSSPDRAERLDTIIKNIAPTVEYTVLVHVGLAILLSSNTKWTWEKY